MSDLMTDQEIFDAAISNEPRTEAPPVVAQPEPEVQPAPVAQVRDDKGRFAAGEPAPGGQPEAQPQPEQPPAAKTEPTIPPSRLREESDARRKAELRNAELETELRMLRGNAQPQPQQPVDMFNNPDAWGNQLVDPVRSEVRDVTEYFSRRLAEQQFGPDKVQEAYAALAQAVQSGQVPQQAVQQLSQSRDPYGEIMAWHQRTSILSEIGNDPTAYRQKIIDGFLSDPANAQRIQESLRPAQPAPNAAPAPSAANLRIPPSLNRQTSAASSAPGTAPDVSDAALFEQTVSRRR